ncbi:MAG: L-fucose-proton symporter [Bacteroidota bacterium]|jgi:FHS family L-fucose permease-like MFS transporter
MSELRASLVPRKYLFPFILVTSLFALWGFANAVTDPMVSAFKKVLELSNFEASLVQLSFYGGYFTMALPAAWLMRRYSYKTGVLVGLVLYGIGALLFYPAAQWENFGFFLGAIYILTFGLAFLETSANPYILALGDPKTATRRLNLAQAFNPVGLVLGLAVAQLFVLRNLQSDDVANFATLEESARATMRTADLMVIRDPYVILGLLVFGILALMWISRMPEMGGKEDNSQFWTRARKMFQIRRFSLGVFSQLLYVGAQIMCWTYIYHYAEYRGIANDNAVNYAYMAFALFLGGRFLCIYLLKLTTPGRLLGQFAILAILLCATAIFSTGMTGLYALVGVSFCMSLMFPTIYGIALKDLGEDAKLGSAFLVMAIVGGAILPVIQGQILDLGGTGLSDLTLAGIPEVNYSFILPLLCFAGISWYGFAAAKGKLG